MAPDQVLPDAPEDPGCHLHSPGAILHRLLTGRLAIRAFRRASKVNPKVPRSFDRMILRAPQEDPDGRYPSAAAMLADIRTLQIP